MTISKLERESLEAHVDLCALRYQQLDNRLNSLEDKVSEIHKDIIGGQKSLNKVIVSTAGTVVVGILGAIVTVLMKM